jgi:nitrile hydratase
MAWSLVMWRSFDDPASEISGEGTIGVAMSRTHDVGGATGFGPVVREEGEPPFHHEWEARVFVLNRLLLAARVYNLDEFRHAVERMPPEEYLASSYYEKWLVAIERLLAEKGVVA